MRKWMAVCLAAAMFTAGSAFGAVAVATDVAPTTANLVTLWLRHLNKDTQQEAVRWAAKEVRAQTARVKAADAAVTAQYDEWETEGHVHPELLHDETASSYKRVVLGEGCAVMLRSGKAPNLYWWAYACPSPENPAELVDTEVYPGDKANLDAQLLTARHVLEDDALCPAPDWENAQLLTPMSERSAGD